MKKRHVYGALEISREAPILSGYAISFTLQLRSSDGMSLILVLASYLHITMRSTGANVISRKRWRCGYSDNDRQGFPLGYMLIHGGGKLLSSFCFWFGFLISYAKGHTKQGQDTRSGTGCL